MIAAGMEAVLIKVAGIGLTTKHLGKTLTEMQPTLTTLVGEAYRVIDDDRTIRRRIPCMVRTSAGRGESTNH
jgi:hypothetical protein